MTIGELAARFGLETHVLRHWEDVGVLEPAERVNGRRRYDPEHVTRIALILRAQVAGLRLDQIRTMLNSDDATRRAVLRQHLTELDERMRELSIARRMIEHALTCRAEDYEQCPVFRAIIDGRLEPA